MMKTNSIWWERMILSLSGMAFLLLVVPGWIRGLCFGILTGVLWCIWIWRSGLPTGKLRMILCHPGVLLAGIALVTGFGCNFYNDWVVSRYTQLAADIAGVSVEVVALACTLILSVLALPSVVCVMHHFIAEAKKEYHCTAATLGGGGDNLSRSPRHTVWHICGCYHWNSSG